MIKVKVIRECGEDIALFGLGLNKSLTSKYENIEDISREDKDKLEKLADKLAKMDGGHNKFLESISVWLDIKLPEKVWSQFDTYRVGMSKQSESKMHTILNRDLTQSDFDSPIKDNTLNYLNQLINFSKNIDLITNELPMGFLQRRIIATNYKALRTIYLQRKDHKLKHWEVICNSLTTQLKHPDWISTKIKC